MPDPLMLYMAEQNTSVLEKMKLISVLMASISLHSARLLDSANEAIRKAFENAVKLAVEQQIKDNTVGKWTGTQSQKSFLEDVMAALPGQFKTAAKSEVKSIMCNFAECPEKRVIK
eukprot:Protomagalhaensia_sp_Gyna_25__2453@NODE_2369_length_1124_cov_46_879263_g1964_i0_p1_GENE_NODE_2369_length_1124_cov_46_879263_g1964_i0NODE_2369_length_1124_cov_46_879263_g1964_i0_p1_ORF_typecomplete_len116_score25_96DUF2621/PF11084_8/0_063Phage_min_cap2/PF06152_11/0_071_NODE_2369_length_1124_cov_46_879263_g1964_i0450797